jgi:hypothetical protein
MTTMKGQLFPTCPFMPAPWGIQTGYSIFCHKPFIQEPFFLLVMGLQLSIALFAKQTYIWDLLALCTSVGWVMLQKKKKK